MRYKDMVQDKIQNSLNKVDLIQRGLRNRNISAEDVVNALNEVKKMLEDADNLVEKETQGLN